MKIDIYNYPTAKETIDPFYMPNYQIAVMDAFRNGAQVEVTSNPCFGWCPVTKPTWDWKNGVYRIIKAKIAEGNNPYNLTVDEVDIKNGWRLLTKKEIEARIILDKRTTEVELWSGSRWLDWNIFLEGFKCCRPDKAYRTKKPINHFLYATIGEWIPKILPKEYGDLALSYISDDQKGYVCQRSLVLSSSFKWDNTDEGCMFWQSVDKYIFDGSSGWLPPIPNRKCNVLADPDFKNIPDGITELTYNGVKYKKVTVAKWVKA